MIRLVVPGLLGLASFLAALIAVSQFIAALPGNPAALAIAQWDQARLATAGISGGRSSGTETVVYMGDNATAGGRPRPVKTQAFARRTRGGSVVVFITRADGEDHTHITLYWLPRQ